jgi:hypothetical protein
MRARILVVGLALLLFSGCPGSLEDPERFLTGGGGDGGGGATCNVEADILTPKCATAGCHDATTAAQGLNLATAGVLGRLRTSTATCTSASGQRMGAFLMNKVGSTPSCGGPMPVGATALSQAELACLNAYLADGGAL